MTASKNALNSLYLGAACLANSLIRRATVSIVPSLGLDTALYATCVPHSIALANALMVISSYFLISEQIPRNNWDKMTPELPRAPFKAPLATASQSSGRRLDEHRPSSLTADCMVKDILVPVSPSGTGNTFNESTFALFISSTRAPEIIILRNSALLIVFGMKKQSPYISGQKNYSLTPIIFTLTVSTIIPVNFSTLYLTLSFKDSATALMETPNFIMTYTSI